MTGKILDDTWAFNPIGSPFPSNPFRVKGDTNQFVALWYKHGKPTCGRAWSNGGVLECGFPFNKVELTGAKDLGGEIQVLTYTGNWGTNRYEYNWIRYSERIKDNYQMVRCGQVTPALMKLSNGQLAMGQIDLNTEIASASLNGKVETLNGKPVQDMLVIVRNLTDPGRILNPFPDCPHAKGSCPPLGDDGWVDLRVKLDKFPPCAVKALDRPLRQEDGSQQVQAVALWYKHGEPVMGKAYEIGDQLAATFGWDNQEFSGDVGSVQLQCFHSQAEQGFVLSWRPFKLRETDGWGPVHVRDCAPCVIITPKSERLGKVLLSKQKASVAWGGKEETYTGNEVLEFMVLCRKPPFIL